VLVESGVTGGSMHALTFARRQGRPIFAIASSGEGFRREGCDRAAREFGAVVVRSVGELAEALGPVVAKWRAERKEGEQHG
jgi:predicted Rossmann fold nucleotide-binding protein DprA/Smf involved in DNA uptake